MIGHMDEGIGAVLDALRAAGAEENTIVVFTSDNGGERYSDTWPLLGKKMDLLEGGIRVPYIVRWPARIRPGGVTAQQAITMDWMPTFLEAAGAPADPRYPLDGISLLPVLEQPDGQVERDLFWRMKFRSQKAARSGDWKYLSVDGYEYLFDLAHDERERANVAKRFPDRLDELKKKYSAWEASLPPIPEDAKFSLVYGPAELPNPS
jgi:arylsulfatase A-like enzyme